MKVKQGIYNKVAQVYVDTKSNFHLFQEDESESDHVWVKKKYLRRFPKSCLDSSAGQMHRPAEHALSTATVTSVTSFF